MGAPHRLELSKYKETVRVRGLYSIVVGRWCVVVVGAGRVGRSVPVAAVARPLICAIARLLRTAALSALCPLYLVRLRSPRLRSAEASVDMGPWGPVGHVRPFVVLVYLQYVFIFEISLSPQGAM